VDREGVGVGLLCGNTFNIVQTNKVNLEDQWYNSRGNLEECMELLGKALYGCEKGC